jgi:PPOX class probable F420-dependent enzyme
MHTMSEAEYKQFLLTSTRTGKLATVTASGAPHITPVWFVLDGDDLIFTTHETSLKAKHIQRDARVSLLVDDETPPYAYALVEGTATLSAEPDDLLKWATAIGARYMGADRAEEFGKRNGVPGEWVVRITPTKIIARAGISD